MIGAIAVLGGMFLVLAYVLLRPVWCGRTSLPLDCCPRCHRQVEIGQEVFWSERRGRLIHVWCVPPEVSTQGRPAIKEWLERDWA
jgi:hypothetical protein